MKNNYVILILIVFFGLLTTTKINAQCIPIPPTGTATINGSTSGSSNVCTAMTRGYTINFTGAVLPTITIDPSGTGTPGNPIPLPNGTGFILPITWNSTTGGPFEVRASYFDNCGVQYIAARHFVTINQKPAAPTSLTVTDVLNQPLVKNVSIPSATGLTAQWSISPSAGTIETRINDFEEQISFPFIGGTYTVYGSYKSQFCTSDTKSTTICLPTVPQIIGNTSVCGPGSSYNVLPHNIGVLSATPMQSGATVLKSPNDPTLFNVTWTIPGTYTLTISNVACNGLSASNSIVLKLGDSAPVASITPGGPTTFCAGGSVVLNATQYPDCAYQWNKNGSVITGANLSSYSATSAGAYTVKITRNKSDCTTTSAPVTIIVDTPNPTIAGDAVACRGDVRTYTTETGKFNYQWTIVGGTINSGQGTNSVNVTWSYFGNSFIKVNYSNSSNGCLAPSETSKTVSVKETPTVTNNDLSLCAGTPSNLPLTSSIAGSTFSWVVKQVSNVLGASNGSGTNINQVLTCSSQSIVSGYVIYTVTATSNGCSSSKDVKVTVKQKPIMNTADKAICENSFTNLVLVSNPTGATYSFTPTATNVSGATSGAGSPINQNLSLVNTNNTGSVVYSVTPTLNSCVGTAGNVTVNVNPSPQVIADNKSVCQGNSVTLTGTPAGGTWSGTGVSGSTFNSSGFAIGNYSVTYAYTNSNNCAKSVTATITVNSLPAATITPSGTLTICQGGSVTLNANTGTGLTYQWTKDGSPTGTGPSYTTSSSGSYTVTVTNANQCSQVSSPAVVSVNALPTVNADDKTGCASTSIQLTGSPTGGVWSGTGVSGSTFNSPTPGTYSVLYTYTNSNGCASSDSASITVTASPSLTSPNKTICSGTNPYISLTSTMTGSTFSWIVKSSLNVTGATSGSGSILSQSLTNSTTSSGEVVYTITTTANGCSSLKDLKVTVNPAPKITAFTGTAGVCPGNTYSYSVTVSGTGPFTYQWEKPSNWQVGYQSGNSAQYYVPQYYPNYGAVRVTVSNSYSCTAADGKTAYPASGCYVYSYKSGEVIVTDFPITEPTLYPNPVKTEFVFRIPISAEDLLPVVLVNQNGKDLKKTQIKRGEDKVIIDITDLPDGIYFLQMIRNGKIEVFEKVMIMK